MISPHFNNFLIYIVIGLLAGIIAFLIHGLFDTESIGGKLFIFNWFFAGIISAITRIKDDKYLLKENIG